MELSLLHCLGLSNDYVPRTISPTPSRSSSSSSDSDVRILNDSLDLSGLNTFNLPSVGPHIIDMPGDTECQLFG
jgi:hypothetical protein